MRIFTAKQLVEIVNNTELSLVSHAIASIAASFPPPFYICSIIGTSRMGKSALFNTLISNPTKNGPVYNVAPFMVSGSSESCTQAIQCFAIKAAHFDATREGTIIFFDTQGYAKGNDAVNLKLLVLSALASSVVIYNVDKDLTETFFNNMYFCSQVETFNKSSNVKLQLKPHLMVCVRNSQLKLTLNNEVVENPNTYLEQMFDSENEVFQQQRNGIKFFFSGRDMILLPPPDNANSHCFEDMNDATTRAFARTPQFEAFRQSLLSTLFKAKSVRAQSGLELTSLMNSLTGLCNSIHKQAKLACENVNQALLYAVCMKKVEEVLVQSDEQMQVEFAKDKNIDTTVQVVVAQATALLTTKLLPITQDKEMLEKTHNSMKAILVPRCLEFVKQQMEDYVTELGNNSMNLDNQITAQQDEKAKMEESIQQMQQFIKQSQDQIASSVAQVEKLQEQLAERRRLELEMAKESMNRPLPKRRGNPIMKAIVGGVAGLFTTGFSTLGQAIFGGATAAAAAASSSESSKK